jgi:hypothetical protein
LLKIMAKNNQLERLFKVAFESENLFAVGVFESIRIQLIASQHL